VQQDTSRPRVVVIGAGFAGLWAARTLAGKKCDVLVVDKNNYHTFLPLLYQVAAAELESEQIAYPVRGIFRGADNVSFAMAQVTGLDAANKTLITDSLPIPYDKLIVAPGSVTNFFGVPGADEHAFRLKSLEQAILLRNHIMGCFERAALSKDPAEQRRLLTFTVVGGGPTGVEYAGALAELIRGPLAKDYPALIVGQARVVLFEAMDGILFGFPDHLRTEALIALRRKGVQVFLGAQVAEVAPQHVRLKDGSNFLTETVAWTAGVKAHPLAAQLGLPCAPNGKVTVDEHMRVLGMPNVLACGDVCQIEGQPPLPMIAPAAIQTGRHAADTVLRELKGKQPKKFRYRDKGSMATIGRGAAVVRFSGQTFTGFIAWALWLVVHLLYLVGFRNRLLVLVNWAWDYFLFERAVRLILPREWLMSKSGLDPAKMRPEAQSPGTPPASDG